MILSERAKQMRVLLSIKPEFVKKIFDGSKKFEYRRSIFRRKEVDVVVVYASDPIKRIVGEFRIGTIIQAAPDELWIQTNTNAGITKKKFMEYFANQAKGYAIPIKDVRKYEVPLSLDDLMLSLAPQSFIYLDNFPLVT